MDQTTSPVSPGGEELLNETQAGRYLGGKVSPISPRTFQRWRMEGKGPVWCSIGRLVRYRRSDLDAWLSEQVRQSTSQSPKKR
jgi:predicted DNA-binding transcriptional regulator AlpA